MRGFRKVHSISQGRPLVWMIHWRHSGWKSKLSGGEGRSQRMARVMESSDLALTCCLRLSEVGLSKAIVPAGASIPGELL